MLFYEGALTYDNLERMSINELVKWLNLAEETKRLRDEKLDKS